MVAGEMWEPERCTDRRLLSFGFKRSFQCYYSAISRSTICMLLLSRAIRGRSFCIMMQGLPKGGEIEKTIH